MEKILVLGGAYLQIPIIEKALDMGVEVIVTDMRDNVPAKKRASYFEKVSTLDVEANIKVGKQYDIDGILTFASDQPVLTVAKVAKELQLPMLISEDTALKVTNKKHMKEAFDRSLIPTAKSYIVTNIIDCKKYANKLEFPIVIKPVDNSGQRGVYKATNQQEIDEVFHSSKKFSRTGEVIIEEYYESSEISLQVWVINYKPYILLITDRIITNIDNQIGICIEHVFPSKYVDTHFEEIKEIVNKIVDSFNIGNGPIYIQMLVGKQGIKVCELACRVGGGNEIDTVKAVSGIDMRDLLLKQTLGREIDIQKLEDYSILDNPNCAIMTWLVGREGRVEKISDIPYDYEGVKECRLFIKKGDRIKKLTGTEKLGMLLCVGKTEKEVRSNTYNSHRSLKILDKDDVNLLALYNEDDYLKYID